MGGELAAPDQLVDLLACGCHRSLFQRLLADLPYELGGPPDHGIAGGAGRQPHVRFERRQEDRSRLGKNGVLPVFACHVRRGAHHQEAVDQLEPQAEGRERPGQQALRPAVLQDVEYRPLRLRPGDRVQGREKDMAALQVEGHPLSEKAERRRVVDTSNGRQVRGWRGLLFGTVSERHRRVVHQAGKYAHGHAPLRQDYHAGLSDGVSSRPASGDRDVTGSADDDASQP